MRSWVPLIVLVGVAACGGQSHAVTYSSPRQMADKLGCSASYADESQPDMFAQTTGTCTYDGVTLTLSVLKSKTALTSALDVARNFTSVEPHGDFWIVDGSQTADRGRRIAAALGGSL